MKKYDINKMLEEWGSTSMSTIGPFPGTEKDPEDVDDLTADEGSKGSMDLNTHFPGPSDPENIPGPDRKKLNIKEAGEIVDTNKPAPTPKDKGPAKEPPMTAPDMKTPLGMGGDPSMGGMDSSMAGGDPSMMGMGITPGPADSGEVGRVYELKKIYSRLVSMQSYLAGTTDVNLIKLRNYVSNTMDLFRTLISNIALYKDRLDEIIVVFYKVVDNVYVILSKYYKDNTNGNDVMVQALEAKVVEGRVVDYLSLKYGKYKQKRTMKKVQKYLNKVASDHRSKKDNDVKNMKLGKNLYKKSKNQSAKNQQNEDTYNEKYKGIEKPNRVKKSKKSFKDKYDEYKKHLELSPNDSKIRKS